MEVGGEGQDDCDCRIGASEKSSRSVMNVVRWDPKCRQKKTWEVR